MSDLDRLIEELDVALWSIDLKYNNFPAEPSFGDKHTDENGQVHTYLGPSTGWAVVGADRRAEGGA